MTRVIAYRLLQFPLILAVIYVLTYLLVWVAPGDPFTTDRGGLDENARQQLAERFNAESPGAFLAYYPARVLLEGDFGPSMAYRGWSVNDILAASLPISMTLGLFALFVATVAGTALGVLAAVRRGGFFDFASLTVALIGISVPSFVVAAVVLIVFAGTLRMFPIGGWGTIGHVILPGVVLSLLPMAYITRLTRVSMLDVLSSDYVRTAVAKGLTRQSVIWKHALRNALLPVLSYLGPAAAATLTGSFVVEKVFNIPGLGEFFINSVLNRDQTLVLGVVMIYSVLLLSLNLLVDLAYTLVDPRIDLEGSAA